MTFAATPDDPRLFERFAAERSEERFRALYRCHTPMVYAMALRLSAGSPSDAEELVQEAWVRAVQRLEAFEGRSSFRSWLCGILINCHREALRQRARSGETLEEDSLERAATAVSAPPTGRRLAAVPIARVDLERAVAELPDGYREVVVLHDVNGYTHLEIAGLLGIEEGTSKSQLARARKRLRARLETNAGAPPPSHRTNEDGHE